MVRRVRELTTTKAKGEVKGILKEQLAQIGLDLAVPGLVKTLVGDASAHLIDRMKDRRRLKATVDLGEERAKADAISTQQLASAVMSTARTDLRAVVVIEDLHLLSEPAAIFLDALVRSERPVLVVGTMWPEGDFREKFADWQRAVAGIIPIEHWNVPRLDESDRRALLIHHAPATDVSVINALSAKYTSPYELRLLLELPRFSRSVTIDGALDLRLEEIDTLPQSIREFHQLRWRELPAITKSAMRIAARAVNVSTDTGENLPFIASIVDQAARGLTQGKDLGEPLHRAVDPLGWFTEQDGAVRFTDAPLAQIAASAWGEEFGRDASAVLEAQVIETLRDFLRARLSPLDGLLQPDDHLAVVASRWLLTLPGTVPGTREVAAAAWLVASLTAASGWHAQAAVTAVNFECRHASGPWAPTLGLQMQHTIVGWLQLAGFPNEALGVLRDVARDTERALGPDHEMTLQIRLDLIEAEAFATWDGPQGPLPSSWASSELETLLRRARLHLAPNAPLIRAIRLAHLTWRDREMPPPPNPAPRSAEWDSLLQDTTTEVGASDPDTLAVLKAYSRSAQITQASQLGLMRELDARLQTVTSDPRVFTQLRYEMANLMQMTDGPQAALDLLARTRADLEREYGPTHPDPLGLQVMEINIELNAIAPGESTAVEQLVKRAKALVASARESVGDRHAATRDAEHVLGYAEWALEQQYKPMNPNDDTSRSAGTESDDLFPRVHPEALGMMQYAVMQQLQGNTEPIAQAWSTLGEHTYFAALLVTVESALHTYVAACGDASRHGQAPSWFNAALESDLARSALGLSDEDLVDAYLDLVRDSATAGRQGPHTLEADDVARLLQLSVSLLDAHLSSDQVGLTGLYQAHQPADIASALMIMYGQTITLASELWNVPFEQAATEAGEISAYLNG